jgi:predicted DNA-binding protein with PD1-like motif
LSESVKRPRLRAQAAGFLPFGTSTERNGFGSCGASGNHHRFQPVSSDETGQQTMNSKLLHESHGARVFAVIMETGDELMEGISAFAKRENISAAQLTAIGALSEITLQYFDWKTKKYQDIPVHEQVEVASMIGDIALGPDGQPAIHVHAVIGKKDGTAMAGHVGEARVRPTLEIIVNESPEYLQKTHDEESGLALINAKEPRRA